MNLFDSTYHSSRAPTILRIKIRFSIPLLSLLLASVSAALAQEANNTHLEARAGNKPDVAIDLTAELNSQFVLDQIKTQLDSFPEPNKGSVPGPVKGRATKSHKDADPVIRIRLPIAVDVCNTVHGHIVYYLFPDNSEYNFKALVDSWDTLTANDQWCQGEVNDKLKEVVPTTTGVVQALIDYRLAPTGNSNQLPNENFPSYRLLPANGGGGATDHVYLVLDRSTIVSRWSDMCMDVQNNDPNQGAKIQQWTCYDADNRRWDLVPTTDGYFAIRNRQSGRYLAVEQSSSANGAKLRQWDWNRADLTFEWRVIDLTAKCD